MERIAVHYTYERRSPTAVDVHGVVVANNHRVEYSVAVFRDDNTRWVTSDSLAIDQGGMQNEKLSDAIYYAREKIETRLRMGVIRGGDKTIATAELDAFMETYEPGNSREELSARVKDLTERMKKLEEKGG